MRHPAARPRHGIRQWAESSSSHDGPLQVARAILLMSPPFEVPLSRLRSPLAPLLETGLVVVEQLEADRRRADQLAQTLEAAVADATRKATQLAAEVSHLQEEVHHLQRKMTAEAEAWMAVLEHERVNAEKRRAAELSALQDVVAAAQRSERALQQRVARVARELEASDRRHLELLAEGQHQQNQLREAEQLESRLDEALRCPRAEVQELRRRPAVDATALRQCLALVAGGGVDRR